ncbi:MAG TPA: outer membrane lipoprotein carrier protein LolA [Puia sp.]|jgi:outer membrane lipoprotein-sorting protein|nr:outer membrane lipoprotein carrier protein LolA [Puia sp.]
MNKLAICFALMLGTCCVAEAQNSNYIGKNDPDAKKVLDALSAKLNSYKAVQANFTLKVEDSKGKLQGSRSGVIYLKGNKYHVSVVGGQEIYCDGKDVYTYDKSSNEVTITKNDPATQTISVDKLFTNFYDKDFLYKLNGAEKQGTRTVEEVELTPVDKTKSFFKVLLFIDKTTHALVSMKVFDKNGSRYTVETSKINGSAPITDAQLAYNKAKFPGAEEVDLRN